MRTATGPSLDAVGAALVDARNALSQCEAKGATHGSADGIQVHDTLVALALASYDALASWEAQGEQMPPATHAVADRVTRWRSQLDDLRVQVALAEMEVRDTSQQVLAAAERSVSVVETRLAAAGKEVGSAVTALRKDLQRVP
ncbi:MAG: hypothetical protein WCD35_14355 [Mycobacteriales bacterium]